MIPGCAQSYFEKMHLRIDSKIPLALDYSKWRRNIEKVEAIAQQHAEVVSKWHNECTSSILTNERYIEFLLDVYGLKFQVWFLGTKARVLPW